MADIYAFPTGVKARGGCDADPGLPGRPVGVPDDVWSAVESIREMPHLRDVRYREIPVPSTLADYGIGVELEAGNRIDGDPASFGSIMPAGSANGWIMILYSNRPRDDWGSRWRCVAFARLPLEDDEDDALAPDMYWDIMCGHLDRIGPEGMGGTVTVTRNTTFGSLGPNATRGCEMRVSFTLLILPGESFDAGAVVSAWARFLRSTISSDRDRDVD